MAAKDQDFFETLYQVAKVVNASLEPRKVLDEITRAVSEAMEVKACGMRVLSPKRDKLVMGACWGLSQDYLKKGEVKVAESGIDRKALAGDAVYIADAGSSPDFQYGLSAQSEGIKSVMVVPLKVGDTVEGVLRVYTDEAREFTDQEKRFLEAVANLSAIALENARLHQALKRDYNLLLAYQDRIDDN